MARNDNEKGGAKGHDDPQQWPAARRWPATLVVVFMTASIAYCSSIHNAVTSSIEKEWGISRTIATLGVTTFLLGFATGPLLFAPLSEVWGRNNIYRTTLLLFVIFNMGCALANNIAALLVFRFFCGFFGSPTVTNSGGSLTDMWPQSHRSVPLALFTAGSFLGPVIAPIVGAFVSQYAGWRWNFWIVTILAGTIYVLMWIALPETYAPYIAERAAIKSNKLDSAKTAAAHGAKKVNYRVTLTRPFLMLTTEPILFLLSLYMAFVYGVLYLDFAAYPIVYQEKRGWQPGIAGLAFLGIAVGMGIATACSPYINVLHGKYTKKLGPVPEARLPHLILLVWLLPVSLFWFGWTALPPIHWAASITAGIPFGLAFVPLFLSITAYLTDCYGPFSASALAANAVLRSIFGAVFPLFAHAMYENMGVPWASSTLGFVAIAMAPLPWVFYKWGPAMRMRSKFHQQVMEIEERKKNASTATDGIPVLGDERKAATSDSEKSKEDV